jgi:RNA polymerase-binding transcription factor DksA/SAM-dependent methyltransferase
VAGTDPNEHTRALAARSVASGDATGWFEQLYAEAEDGGAVVPWDRGTPNPLLAEWARTRQPDGTGRSALVVGCGLGRDAEFVAGFGFDTVAFDISPTAVRGARARFPDSRVRYVIADLLDPPEHWHHAFDLVVESMTIQALPDPPRRAAIREVARLVAPGGTLIVIAFASGSADAGAPDEDLPDEGPPWPLRRAEIDAFAVDGLHQVRVEEITDNAVHRVRAEFQRTNESDRAGKADNADATDAVAAGIGSADVIGLDLVDVGAVAEVAEVLVAERVGTAEQITILGKDLAEIISAARSVATDDEHDPEGVTIAFERAQVAANLDRARGRLADLDWAIGRLAEGSYGRCERCGQPIAPGRLVARPAARTCIACASRR